MSTDEQGESGLGLEWQRGVIETEAARRGWDLLQVHTDVASGKSLRRRHEMQAALTTLALGGADVLIVAKLDRLSRSVSDFAAILAQSHEQGWSLDVCDLGVDTTSPGGKMVAQIMMVLAEWEREMIGERTRNALEVARSRGTKLGRPSGVDDDTLRLIRILRAQGLSWAKVAAALEAEGIATGQGGRWHAATVRRLALAAGAGEAPTAEPLPVG